MAITWTVKITPVNISRKIVRISATRTDDVLLTTFTAGMLNADISTQQKKNEALDILWAKYQTQAARQSQIDSIIGDLETLASQNLEGRE